MSAWKSESIPHEDGYLFEAIVTARDGKQLIAQCTTLDFAKDIEDKHNRFDVELTQLRAELQAEKLRADTLSAARNVLAAQLEAAQARIAQLTTDAGESGLAAINRLLAACESGDGIDQHCAPDLQAARDEIVRQAAQLEQAYTIAAQVAENCAKRGAGTDRRYKVAMDIARQLREIAANAQPQERIEKSGAVILNGHIKIEGIKDNGENYLTTNLVVNNAVSDVELAAYRYYLGESSNRLYELFEDMPTDERERYRKANAPQEQSA